MKTVFLKFSAILLAGLMLLPLLAACDNPPSGSTPADSSSKGGQTSFTEEEEGKPVINERFDGQTVNFYVTGAGLNSRSIDIGEGDDPTYSVNVQVKKRNEQVEKELGVDIVLKEVDGMSSFPFLLPSILASGVYTYDVLSLYQYFDLGYALDEQSRGCFYDLNDLPEGVTSYLNPNASYWSKVLYEGLDYKDTAFYITGDLNQSYLGTMFVSYVNTRLWEEYKDEIADLEHSGGYCDPYEIVKKGYWTMDLLMELANLVYEDDGDKVKNYTDQAGFMTYDQQLNNIMVDMLLAGCGIRHSSIRADGTPDITIDTPENKAIYEKLYKLLCESGTVTIPWLRSESEDETLYILDVFAAGKVLVNVNILAGTEEYLADMKDGFTVLPLPMLDRAQFDESSPSLGYASQTGDSVSQYAICKAIGDEKLPCVTATLELMAYYSEKWVTPAYYQAALGKLSTDLRVREMLELTRAGLYTDFALIWSSHLDNVIWQWRQHFTEKDKIEKNLRYWDRSVTGKLQNGLLDVIEKGFDVKDVTYPQPQKQDKKRS
ncbi:MAG: hypothetical protein IJZ33_02165 [Clostridia bacterium]|nr:hypothetical protein [Clostridia bacterium]